jgi:hypothetical protein
VGIELDKVDVPNRTRRPCVHSKPVDPVVVASPKPNGVTLFVQPILTQVDTARVILAERLAQRPAATKFSEHGYKCNASID